MKNSQKLAEIVSAANEIQRETLMRFLEGKTIPRVLYSNDCNAGIKAWDVTSVDLIHVVHSQSRPSNKDVQSAQERLDKLKCDPVDADSMNVIIHLCIESERTSTGVPWARLEDKSYGYFVSESDAIEANRKWHEEHDHRLGHFACDYCRKQTPDTQRIVASIWRNGGRENRQFCSSEHASFDQFASEG